MTKVKTLKPKNNERMCVLTRTVHPKKNLIRICRIDSQSVVLDLKQTYQGRGMYFSNIPNAALKLKQKNLINKILKVSVQPEWYEQLAAQLDNIKQ